MFVFSTTPMGVKKITSPPSCVKKEKDTKEKKGGVCSRFKAYRLAPSVEGHRLSRNTFKVFKVFYI